jgi:hypothetical protein
MVKNTLFRCVLLADRVPGSWPDLKFPQLPSFWIIEKYREKKEISENNETLRHILQIPLCGGAPESIPFRGARGTLSCMNSTTGYTWESAINGTPRSASIRGHQTCFQEVMILGGVSPQVPVAVPSCRIKTSEESAI